MSDSAFINEMRHLTSGVDDPATLESAYRQYIERARSIEAVNNKFDRGAFYDLCFSADTQAEILANRIPSKVA